MPIYHIKATYEYEGTVEADSPEDAETIFLDDLNSHYSGTEDYSIEEIAVCNLCDSEIDLSEIDESGLCYACEVSLDVKDDDND